MEFVPPKFYYFFISPKFSIDNYEMTNVFNMLDFLNYTAIETYKSEGQWYMISSAGEPEHI